MRMSQQTFQEIGTQFTQQYGTVSGNLFGKPCLKVQNKAFAAFFQEEMAFKLGRNQMEARLEQYPGAQLWDPSGKKRPMKDWLQVPASFEAEWSALARQAMEFVEAGI